MALPSSGPLSFSQIAGELGVTGPKSLRSMSSCAGFSTPDAVSEFYNYTHTNFQAKIGAFSSSATLDLVKSGISVHQITTGDCSSGSSFNITDFISVDTSSSHTVTSTASGYYNCTVTDLYTNNDFLDSAGSYGSYNNVTTSGTFTPASGGYVYSSSFSYNFY